MVKKIIITKKRKKCNYEQPVLEPAEKGLLSIGLLAGEGGEESLI